MLEVKIDLVPMGYRSLTRQLGYVKIWNDASGTDEIGNYKYEVKDEHNEIVAIGEYKGFKRLEKNVFQLMQEILNDAL